MQIEQMRDVLIAGAGGQHAARHELRQLKGRLSKIRRRKAGTQTRWLLWKASTGAEANFFEWMRRVFAELAMLLPEGIYKAAAKTIMEAPETVFFDERNGPPVFRTPFENRIVMLPRIGIVAFFAPSRNLRRAIDPQRTRSAWNWSFPGEKFEHAEPAEAGQKLDHAVLEGLWRKFGRGKGATFAIIDSGICRESSELEDRVIARWGIRSDQYGVPRWDFSDGNDEVGHGTKVASIVAGAKFGIAPESEVISLKVPMYRTPQGLRYDLLSLVATFEMLASKDVPMVKGAIVTEKVKTLVVPNGVYLARKKDKVIVAGVFAQIAILHNRHDIAIVSAIGNRPLKAAFPASDAQVFSVGCIDDSGVRWVRSGVGVDSVGSPVPIAHFRGVAIPCEGLCGAVGFDTGTSMSAGGIAGLFTLLSARTSSATERWRMVRNLIVEDADAVGPLPVISLRNLDGKKN